MLNIYINTWGNYNENGCDGGQWITLPMDEEELKEKLNTVAQAMNDNDPEWFVNDHEWTTDMKMFEVHELDNYFKLNEQLNDLNELEEWEREEIAAAVEAWGYSFMEAYERQQQGCFIFYSGQNLNDVAHELMETYFIDSKIPDFFQRHFNYESFENELSCEGYVDTKYGVILDPH